MEFARKLGKNFVFKITQVLGLTNDDAVSYVDTKYSRCQVQKIMTESRRLRA